MKKDGVDRREFASKAGKFALLAPAITYLLSTSMTSDAIAHSGGGGGRPRRPKRRRNHRPEIRRGGDELRQL